MRIHRVTLFLLIIVATSSLMFCLNTKAQSQANFVQITTVDYPQQVAKSETFGIPVLIAYNFTKPASLQVSIYDQENNRLATEFSGTLIGRGIAHFDHLRVTAPKEDAVWNLLVSLYVYNSSEGISYYVEGQNVSVVVGSGKAAATSLVEEFSTASYLKESTTDSYVAQITTTRYVEDYATDSQVTQPETTTFPAEFSTSTLAAVAIKSTKGKLVMPLSFWDFSLWTAIVAVILLVTSELMSPYYGRTKITVDRHRLRIAALLATIVFLSTVAYRIYEIVTKH